MFTGIIEEVGSVIESGEGRLRIGCLTVLEGTRLGDSIAINGVDLTVVKGPITIAGVSLTVIAKDSDSLTVSLVPFPQEHTNLTRKKPGETVNLESDIIARYVDQLLSERT